MVQIPDDSGRVGEKLPDIMIFDLELNPVPLNKLIVHPALFVVLELDNPASRAQIIPLERILNTKKNPVKVYAAILSYRRNALFHLKNFLGNRPVNFPVFFSEPGIRLAFRGIQDLPLIVATDSTGIVIHRQEGYMSYNEITDTFDHILIEDTGQH